MTVLKKCLLFAVFISFLLIIIYCLSLRNERDRAIYLADKSNEQLNTIIAKNKDLRGTIDILQFQADQNDSYIIDLEQRKEQSELKANQLLHQFKNAKKASQKVDDWANTKLPKELFNY